jgi:DedD protein
MTKQVSTDEESNLIRKARRRLIGAVALTTSLVVILPMIFDREPLPGVANEIELQIPDQNKIADLPAASAVMSNSSVGLNETVSRVQNSETITVAASATASAVPAQTNNSLPNTDVTAPTETPSTPHHAVENTQPPAPKLSPYALQVGAYATQEKAKTVSEKLNKLGFHAYTDQGADNVRVRIGGFHTREEADKVRQTLESQGFHVNVLRLEK